MLAGMSLGTELKRFSRGLMPRVALVTIVLMPLLYGALYLWAFWDPFAATGKIPVALVNNDQGTVVDGKPLDAGDQVAQGLKDSGDLDFHEVTAYEASTGVASGRYYFSVTLPGDFSRSVASPTGPDPRKAQIVFTYNDANNYLGTVIGQNAAQQILNIVGAQIGEQSVDQVLLGLGAAGDGLRKAADGAGQLAAGAQAADAGAQQLAGGSRTLADGLTTAHTGSTALADGTAQLSGGIDTAAGGASALAGGMDQLSGATAALGDGAGQLSTGVNQLVDRISGALGPALDAATVAQLGQLRDGAQQLAFQLGDPSSPYRSGMTQAVAGSGQLRDGLAQLQSGGQQAASGARALDDGLTQLSGGSETLAQGSQQLATGIGQLKDGSGELASQLKEGSKQVPTWDPQQRTAVAQTVSSPIALDQHHDNRAKTFGTGFAPFFLPLALFVGGIITWMLLRPIQNRPISTGLGALRVVLASYWPAALIAIAQVLVMYVVVHFGVGLVPVYVFGTIAFLGLVGLTYMAMIQAFNAIFGPAVGRVVTLAFLMLQLVSSGGIYPVETTAKPFQILHPFDPMTYAVNGLRQLTVGGIDSRLWVSIAVLLGLLLASLAASALSVRRDRTWTLMRLHPPIEV
ncbi:YhgE/Pip domain-containing protein [Prescottella agglutinans]|uniref:YhgE/Pip domain-containing protein n=1 Tax=Prescottella agglutinans TaxID=1644129 RepID=A0A3S3AP02_9NOCA|nr:YhgE/Pip domain-containing protein [Prescottella agglutinans]RVW09360.1 YhgE/Pip domain-containing protein [Prescottella agglutinans]